jgi:hypothetical protein
VGSSVEVWQETQPEDDGGWSDIAMKAGTDTGPTRCSCAAKIWELRRANRKDAAETQRTLSVRREQEVKQVGVWVKGMKAFLKT